jgi:predicted outer membrane protein
MKSAIALAALTLAACGSRQDLRPKEGQSLPPKPYAVATDPTPSEMMTAGTQARPQRSDDLLNRSQERRNDKFDLPPPG